MTESLPKPMVLYVATSNPGKLRDFAYAAEGTPLAVSLRPLPGLDRIPAPPEDEVTFEGNARGKALYYAQRAGGLAGEKAESGLSILADDSGLEVACLEGAPGVRSARYAEDVGFPFVPASTTDERNNAALLRALDGIPAACRQARYRCVLALARVPAAGPPEIVATAEGSLDGEMLTAPRGRLGFGYDPLFLIPELGKTMAELDPMTRVSLSHRGRALRALLEQIKAGRL